MTTETITNALPVSDDAIVTRLYDLACSGQTESREYQLLDYVIQKRLLQAYGNELARTSAFAA